MVGQEHTFTIDDILDVLPHREPFLFVDRVVRLDVDRRIVTERVIRDDEPHFAGHFPGRPMMPGVLVTDALAQTAGLLWGLSKKVHGDDGSSVQRVFLLAAANMKYLNPAVPGETLTMTAQPERTFGAFYTYMVDAHVGRKAVAKGTLTLAMKEGEP
ncbi:MAG: 3-hydroxyacyl-[acyl-carrier-protein] dehydratase FabZ [Chitinivibrionales bacterium]|nr:3-hydroxyacyl-[acyl-carrier-protein] dehydratase FabZ [Chitinivibrionales bacterium]